MAFNELIHNKCLIVPISIWAIIQLWKFIWDSIKTRKINFRRLLGAGGMPSSHSAVVTSLMITVGSYKGWGSPEFALAVMFACIVMYDAAGVRRAAGKQARILNQIVNTKEMSELEVREKLVEVLGHTPFEVFIGALIGVVYALIII